MKAFCGLILLFYSTIAFAQGTSCNNSHVLTLDGVCRDYTISTSTGTADHCSTSPYGGALYTGTGRITIFSFTTNASGSCVLIDLTTSGGQAAEVTLWAKCTSGGAGNLQNPEDPSSICFNDGTGLWAPHQNLILAASTTYFLRVWTPGPGTITMCARNYTPPNSLCSGATAIGPTPIPDNNACHKGTTEVLPEHLCALSLENTAFYTYTVAYTGASIITISNITCDNSNIGVDAGFQVGFFTGNCGSLTPVNCFEDSSGTFQATTNSFPAGTNITVAIDGLVGSNCAYTISAINAITLPAVVKYFTAWVRPGSNNLRWISLQETQGARYEIEKSLDGINFFKIGNVTGVNHSNSQTDYGFDDFSLMPNQFYRLKIISANSQTIYSNIIQAKRPGSKYPSVVFQNYASDRLVLKVNSTHDKNASIQVIDVLGRQMKVRKVQFDKGENSYTIDIYNLSKGLYYLVFSDYESRMQYSFIKQ
jgi:hypothetical protein